MDINLIIIAGVISLILQFFDSSVGMGYGLMTPILLLLGFPPIQVVFAVIFSSAVLSLLAGGLHHMLDNVDLSPKKKGKYTNNFKVLLLLSVFGIVGVSVGAFFVVNLSETFLKIYIGGISILIGLLVILKKNRKKLSMIKLTALGIIAAFNKGVTGGGYGPVLGGGQIISGVKPKIAVSITAIVEGIVSLAGIIILMLLNPLGIIHWSLIVFMIVGGLFSTPIAVYAVKKSNSDVLKIIMGTISVILGVAIIFNLLIL